MSYLTFVYSASEMAGSLYQTICLSREQPSNPNLRNQISSANLVDINRTSYEI